MRLDILRGAPPYTKGQEYLGPHHGSCEPRQTTQSWKSWNRCGSFLPSFLPSFLLPAGVLGSGAGTPGPPRAMRETLEVAQVLSSLLLPAGVLGSGEGTPEPHKAVRKTLGAAQVLRSLLTSRWQHLKLPRSSDASLWSTESRL